VAQLATDPARDAKLRRLRAAYPVFRIEGASASADSGTVRLSFAFACGDKTFSPSIELTGLRPDEAARVATQEAGHIVRALALVEAASYWKAFCSPVIEIGIGIADPAETAWWESFFPPAMGEFFYRNGVLFTEPGFLRIITAQRLTPAEDDPGLASGAEGSAPPLVMFSGGKDSLALVYAIRESDAAATDMFLYNPTSNQRRLAGELANGGRIIEAHRSMLPELLAMNDSGEFLNGHTPYSALLALLALLSGYLRGSAFAVAGNSRSDDEPNVSEYLGRPVNHQWTKSAEYEQLLSEYRARWLPGAPHYCSPLRPLLELQIIRSLAPHLDAYLQTQSCNKTKSNGWCRNCAKCAWVFLATSVLFGHSVAVAKAGGDMFDNPALSGLYQAMAGLDGDKPFECTGTEQEVRACIQAVGQGGGNLAALAACLSSPEIAGTRPLEVVLKDWGRDDLMPAHLRERIQRAASI
jgi:hypothetical protein